MRIVLVAAMLALASASVAPAFAKGSDQADPGPSMSDAPLSSVESIAPTGARNPNKPPVGIQRGFAERVNGIRDLRTF